MTKARPTTEEWREALERPGQDGGLAALVIDYEAECQKHKEGHAKLKTLTMNDIQRADRDLRDAKYQLALGAKRKATPSWSLSLELFSLLLDPKCYSIGKDKQEGIGYRQDREHAELGRRLRKEAGRPCPPNRSPTALR